MVLGISWVCRLVRDFLHPTHLGSRMITGGYAGSRQCSLHEFLLLEPQALSLPRCSKCPPQSRIIRFILVIALLALLIAIAIRRLPSLRPVRLIERVALCRHLMLQPAHEHHLQPNCSEVRQSPRYGNFNLTAALHSSPAPGSASITPVTLYASNRFVNSCAGKELGNTVS